LGRAANRIDSNPDIPEESFVYAKSILCLLSIAVCVSISGVAQARVLYDQPLANWSDGFCSPCSGDFDGAYQRTFGSFSLSNETTIQKARFAVSDFSPLSDVLHISIWDVPNGSQLFSTLAFGGSYTKVLNPDANDYFADVALPNWRLAAGSYWISLFGTNGNRIGWGTDFRGGDDAQYNFDGSRFTSTIYVGFTLYGHEGIVPEPGTLALILGGMVGVVSVRRSHRPATTAFV
jgi:hypothetical protein